MDTSINHEPPAIRDPADTFCGIGFKFLFEALNQHAIVSITDADGTIVHANDKFCEISGYSRDELIGRNHRIIKSNRHPPLFYETLWKTIKAGKVWNGLIQNRKKNGAPYWVKTTIMPVLNEQGIPEKFISIRTDLTEHILSKQDARESNERFRGLVESTSDWVWEVDQDAVYTYVSPKVEEILGYPPEEVIGKTPFDLMPEAEARRIRKLFEQIANDRAPINSLENINLHRNGSEVVLETSGVPIVDSTGKLQGYRGVDRNITARKEAENQQAILRQQLNQAQKMEAIGQLTAGIAHDFNNILGGVLGYTELSIEHLSPENLDRIRDYLGHIKTSGERARDLIRKMLVFSRSEAREITSVDPVPLIQEAVSLLSESLPTTIALTTHIEKGYQSILTEPVQLHQAILNLIINARDAIDKHGEISIHLGNINVSGQQCSSCFKNFSGDYVELAIRDTGSGINTELMERMFNPFFSTKEPGKGTGMGLSMVHGIMHECGGHITVDSNPGMGTRIGLLFKPAHGQFEGTGIADREHRVADNPPHASGNIMIVDDEPLLAMLSSEIVQSQNFSAQVFTSSRDALTAFMESPDSFDLIITDQTMPGLTGMDMVNRVHEVKPQIPVILASGTVDVNLESYASDNPSITVMKKPISMQALIDTIDQIMAGQQQRSQGS